MSKVDTNLLNAQFIDVTIMPRAFKERIKQFQSLGGPLNHSINFFESQRKKIWETNLPSVVHQCVKTMDLF